MEKSSAWNTKRKHVNNMVEILLKYLQQHHDYPITEVKKRQLILVNSNFNYNYYLNRDKLVHILKLKYNIKCGMDSCSYPGIQCKYLLKNNQEISFMIFRTGSVLIVGKCNDDDLFEIYNFLKKSFKTSFIKLWKKKAN